MSHTGSQMNAYLELSFDLGALDAEVAETACFDCGAGSVTFVDAHDDRVRFLDLLVMRADPQSPSKAHGVKVTQPFAFPDTIFNALDMEVLRANTELDG